MRRLLALVLLGLAGAIVGMYAPTHPVNAVVFQPVDEAASAGISEVTRTWSANVGDFNSDGKEDFFLVRHDPQGLAVGDPSGAVPRLYQNTGGQFVQVNSFAGKDRHGCDWGDVNRDGQLDLFCAVGLTANSVNILNVQTSDGSFPNVASAYGLTANTHGRYRTASFINANGDQWPDIYVTRYYGPSATAPAEDPPFPNELWINSNGTSYHRDSSFGLDEPIGAPHSTFPCNQAKDYNNDGYQDLLVCGAKGIRLYENQQNQDFRNATSDVNLGGFWKSAKLVDMNRDGDLDLVLVNNKEFKIRYWTGSEFGSKVFSLSFSDEGGESLATGDFNGDGRTDVYVVRNCPAIARKTDRSDFIILNEGGDTYSTREIPPVPKEEGCGQSVSRIDYDQDGLDDFVVLNGRTKTPGPVQLWSWKPST